MIRLRAGDTYSNTDSADWFAISYGSFMNRKQKKLEELKQYAEFEETPEGIHILEVYKPVYKKNIEKVQEEENKKKTSLEKYLLGELVAAEEFTWDFKMEQAGIRDTETRLNICAASRTYPCQDIFLVMDDYGVRYLSYSSDCTETELKESDRITDSISDRVFVRLADVNTGMRCITSKEREILREYMEHRTFDMDAMLLSKAKEYVSIGLSDSIIEARLITAMQLSVVYAINLAYDLLYKTRANGIFAVQVIILNSENETRKIADKYIKKAQNIMSTTKNH